MKPTDDEMEAIAAGVLAQTSWGVPLDAEFAQKTAAMLRACKGRVRVKPLVWEQARDGAGWHPQLTIAYCPIFEKRFYAEHPGKQAKIEAAREARVLAALEPAANLCAPSPTDERVKRLVALLREAREDLAVYVDADYPETSRAKYPDIQRRWRRDMELCSRIDAALRDMDTAP